MPRRSILTARQRASLFDLPTDEARILYHYTRPCCANAVLDSPWESNVIADRDEHTGKDDLHDYELARLQPGAKTAWIADRLVRSGDGVGGGTLRQAWPPTNL